MRIDLEWLGGMLGRELDPEQLAEQLTIGGLEVDSVEFVRHEGQGSCGGDGAVLTLDITPNRGDCFSVLGIAREVSALNGRRLKEPEIASVATGVDDIFPVTLQAPTACPRFAGRVIRNLNPGCRSPDWLESRLQRAGLRALHPVVDVTNYVMLELGQPLHGYDLGSLRGGISVRFAGDGEQLTLLDGNAVTLSDDVLVIADESGAIGLAGVMGGQGTAVSDATCDVFLEAAFFAPRAIAGRPRRYGLHTDASLRFERGVDPLHQSRAIERATELLLEIAGGDPGPVVETVAAEALPVREPITLRLERLNGVLGTDVEPADVESKLDLLHLASTSIEGGWSVVPPSFRFDLGIEEDLVEEVGRMVGYDEIPVAAESSPRHVGVSTETRLSEDAIADALCARGYDEVITYGFVDEELAGAVNPGADAVRLKNPLSSEMAVMRQSLWPGLLVTAQQNLSRQRTRARLFEIGTQFSLEDNEIRERRVLAGLATGSHRPEHWDGGVREVDLFDVKSDVDALLALAGRDAQAVFRPADHPALARGKSARLVLGNENAGWLGVLDPRLQQRMGWNQQAVLFAVRLKYATRARIPRFRAYSKFPSLRRDIAVVVDENVSAEQLLECVRQAAGEALHEAHLFDVYRGKGIDSGRKSIALGLILQDRSRTLTDADADRVVASATRMMESGFKATIRE